MTSFKEMFNPADVMRRQAEYKIKQDSRRPSVQTVRYRNAKEFDRDAENRFQLGWHMEGHSAEQGRRITGTRVVLLGPAALLLWKRRKHVTVTWVRNGVDDK